MNRRLLSVLLVVCLIFTQFPLTASAAGTGTLYKNFSEITNASAFTNGSTYIFLKTHYSSSDAVTSISGETAKLTMTATVNASGRIDSNNGWMYGNIAQYPSKYVSSTSADRGSGFDGCDSGGIIYTTISTLFTGQWGTAATGTGWYYWCSGGACRGSGPYYAYTYDTVAFTERDIDVAVIGEIGVTDTVTIYDLSVRVNGYNVTDYTITDGSVTGTDRTIGLNVGGVTLTKTVGAVITFTKNPSSTGSTTTQVKTPGKPIYAPNSDGTYSGHTFKGWTLSSGSSTVNYLPGSEFNVDDSTTLYAVWVPIIYYTVTINGNSQQVESGTTVSAPGTNPAKATEYFNGSSSLIAGADDETAEAVKKIAYTFTGWKNTTTSQFWDFSTAITGPLTLLPDYGQTVHYKVVFIKNNATSIYTAANQWIIAGQHVTEVTAPTTVTSGTTTYYFAGWNTMQNGTGEYWNFYGDVVNNNLTLYAQWNTVNAYNVTFDDNLADPKDDYVWNTGSLTQNGVAATGYVTFPVIHRVDYVFDGWYTESNCNASNAYNINRTLSGNNASGIDTDNDKAIMLYAKWLPEYTDILISSSSLAGGTYADFYSDFVDAFENNANYNTSNATQVYRNFYLVSSNGTLVNPSTLPAGLYLNSRTGEIYGVPTAAAGNYSFHIRLANDEDRWISLTYPITIHLSNSALGVDMKDDNTGFSKTYGGNDPGFFSNQLSITATGAPAVVYDADGTDVTLTYHYTATKTSRSGNEATFSPTSAATLKYAPDLLHSISNSISNDKTEVLGMAFKRVSGEDAGVYKLFMAADNVSGAAIHYDISIANALLAPSLTYGEGNSHALTTAPEYVFTVNDKSGASYNGESSVTYGTYASGEDVKASLASGSGLVSNAGIKVIDAFQTVTLISLNVSRAGKLIVGTYGNGFAPVITNTISPKGTSQAEGATTSANYSNPAFSLTISSKVLTAVKKNYGITAGSHFDADALANLISLDSLHGDFVGLTITALTLGETTYNLTNTEQKDAAETALANLAATVGSYPMSIAYSTVLTGSDAGNYCISAGTVSDAALNVNAAVACHSGTAPLVYAVVSLDEDPVTAGGNDTHGAVTSSTDRASNGSDVTLTMDPEAGYRLNGLRILDTDGNGVKFTDNNDGTFSFKMPANGVTYDYYFGPAAVDPGLTGVSTLLETESHNAYLHGYPTGSLKPTGSMTRAEAAQMLYNLLIVKPVNPASSFHDVESSQWFCTAVASMAELGLVMGCNGNFRPDDAITRAEFAAMVVRFSKAINCSCNYTDLTDSFWAYKSIATATTYGWITGSGGFFRPNDNITRAEVSTIMNRVLGRVPDRFYIGSDGSSLNEFKDLTSDEWFYCDMIDATNGHVFDLTPSSLELWGNTK